MRIVRRSPGETCYQELFGYDQPCSFCKLREMISDDFYQRDFCPPGGEKVCHMRGHMADWVGRRAHVEYIGEVTKVREAETKSRELPLHLKAVLDSVPCGLALYRTENHVSVPIIRRFSWISVCR